VSEFKTIKVTPEAHAAISARADILGIKLQRYTDALLLAALKLPDENVIEELKAWANMRNS